MSVHCSVGSSADFRNLAMVASHTNVDAFLSKWEMTQGFPEVSVSATCQQRRSHSSHLSWQCRMSRIRWRTRQPKPTRTNSVDMLKKLQKKFDADLHGSQVAKTNAAHASSMKFQ